VPQSPFAAVKVGGSLLDWPELPERLSRFLGARARTTPGEKILLVAGGGPAADLIRALDQVHHLGNPAAHSLALHALDLAARVLERLVPHSALVDRIEHIDRAWHAKLVPILAPRAILEELAIARATRLPESWDVTSDSIAAWIAVQLGAGSLVLLKSASVHAGATRREAAALGLVDPLFPELATPLARVEYLNLRAPLRDPEPLAP
jgi:aspartokinase-like uncharacterized kinase